MSLIRSDEELRRDVPNELRSDERLGIDELDVSVGRRVVTLTGKARTPGQSWRALQLARHVDGIAPVANKMAVETGR